MPASDVLLRSQTDERLAALARGGSERAFVLLVERHRRLLYAAALRLVPAADADDLVQQSLLQAWRALAGGTEVQAARAWLLQILRRTAQRQLAQRLDAEALDDVAVPAAADAYNSLQVRATLRATLAGVARLPEQQRVALLRSVVAGDSQREIAVALGTSEGGVRQLVHRARQTLRAALTAVTPWPLIVRAAGLPGGGAAAGGAGVAGAGLATKVAVGLATTAALTTAGLSERGRHPARPGAAPALAEPAPARVPASGAATPALRPVSATVVAGGPAPVHRHAAGAHPVESAGGTPGRRRPAWAPAGARGPRGGGSAEDGGSGGDGEQAHPIPGAPGARDQEDGGSSGSPSSSDATSGGDGEAPNGDGGVVVTSTGTTSTTGTGGDGGAPDGRSADGSSSDGGRSRDGGSDSLTPTTTSSPDPTTTTSSGDG